MKNLLCCLLLTSLIFSTDANSQTVTKVLGDITWIDDKVINNNINSVQPMLCNTLFYSGYDPEHGIELWAVDLETDISYLVKDINPGPKSSILRSQSPILVKDKVVFLVEGDNGLEIWQSDGSEQGTTKFLELTSGLERITGIQMFSNGNVFYFGSRNITNSVISLFVSDGTIEGTKIAYSGIAGEEWYNPDISSGGAFTRFEGDDLHFLVNKKNSSVAFWYKTDLNAGTFRQLRTVFDRTNTVSLNGNDYFIGSDPSTNFMALYKFDGVSNLKVKALPSYSNSEKLTKVNGILYFFIGDDDFLNENIDEQSVQLWRSDGTTNGTFRIRTFDTKLSPYRWEYHQFRVVELNNKAYFLLAGNEFQKTQIWAINATGTTADLAVEIPGNGDFMSNKFQSVGSYMYFFGYLDNDYRIWKTNGSESGTKLLPNVPNGELAGTVILPSVNDHLIVPAFGDHSRQTRTFWHYRPDYNVSHNSMDEFGQETRDIFLASDVSCIKVCADGTESSVFKITGKISEVGDLSNYELRIEQDTAGDTLTFGKFTILSVTPSEITVKYRHPFYLLSNGSNKNLTIGIYNKLNSNNLVSVKFNLEVLPAPVLMVHGIWANKSSFETMEAQLHKSGYSKTLTERADYEDSNSKSFLFNLPVISDKIKAFTNKIRASGISCGRIDYVAHSMGGLLGRMYLESDSYRGDLRRMITVNTPHSGSEFANEIATRPNLSTAMCGVGHCNNGAVDNLKTYSEVLLSLNNKTRQKKIALPSHAITTVAAAPVISNSFRAMVYDEKVVYLAPYDLLKEEIFGANANDWVVTERSQMGGLTGKCTSRFSDQIHMGSTANQNVIAKVINLLSSSPDSDNFCPYFEPEDLSASSTSTPLRVAATELAVTSPTDKAYIAEGSEMTFSLEGLGLESAIIIVEQSADSVYIAKISSSPFSIKLQTDKKYSGLKHFTVYGKFSSGEIAIIEQTFTLGPEAALPVVLSDISARSEENNIVLSWTTSREQNFDKFIIERSHDAFKFQELAAMNTKTSPINTVGVSVNYNFTDYQPITGINYYRLKMIDNDGSFSYSKTVSERAKSAFSIYPNPTSSTVYFNGNYKNSDITITDSKGVQVLKMKVPTNGEITLKDISNGLYIIEIKRNNQLIHRQKIVYKD